MVYPQTTSTVCSETVLTLHFQFSPYLSLFFSFSFSLCVTATATPPLSPRLPLSPRSPPPLCLPLLPACEVGFYKPAAGDGLCGKCPLHSHSETRAALTCPCDSSYYRAPSDPPAAACTREHTHSHPTHTGRHWPLHTHKFSLVHTHIHTNTPTHTHTHTHTLLHFTSSEHGELCSTIEQLTPIERLQLDGMEGSPRPIPAASCLFSFCEIGRAHV